MLYSVLKVLFLPPVKIATALSRLASPRANGGGRPRSPQHQDRKPLHRAYRHERAPRIATF